jgi:2',3'-cyclic-nucleotide 2'-phosphodiesterase (5'-nucleotidase family)
MTRLGLVVLGLAAAGCGASAPAPPAPAPSVRVEVTLLFTTDEHGWLLPHAEGGGKERGGAAELLGQWVADEGHCPGPPSPPCADPRTLALSGGDNFTGPAISTYFDGEPMAEAMARMGYAASAFGNHEFDFGRDRFLQNRARSRVVYLSANLHAPPSMPEVSLPPFAIFERRGIKIGVVGLTTSTTLSTAMASRFDGITFEREEPALERAVRGAWAAGADMVVTIAHECPDVLRPIVERHPDLRLSFVGAGHCHKLMSLMAGSVPVISPGWRLDRYARVRVTADPSRPAGERVIAVDPSVVEVPRAGAAPDPEIARLAAGWKARVDAALGEEIGYSGAGFEKGSTEMGRWIAGAWREEMGTDVAIVNAHGIRQGVPRGPITKATVWSVLPFDNRIMIVRLKGSALLSNLRNKAAVVAGVARGPDGGFTLEGGRAIDPEAVYSVATVDFLYFGGDHFTFQKDAVVTVDTGTGWRDPVIAWTRKQRTTAAAPIELRFSPR